MRPDLETTRRMYDLHCQGLTLQQVADLEGVSNQTVSKRFKRQGLSVRPRTSEDRFWSKVDKSAGVDGCWIWTAYKDSNGYGWVTINSEKRPAHRVAYESMTGERLGELELDHACHNPSCVNPHVRHARPATHKQNMENRAGAQRNSTTGVRGVYPVGSRFMARVQHNGEVFHLGVYATIAEAEAVACSKRLELFSHNEIDGVSA